LNACLTAVKKVIQATKSTVLKLNRLFIDDSLVIHKRAKVNQQRQGIYRIDGYVIDSDRRLILAAGNEVEIQPRAFNLLVHLLENHDRAVSKEELQGSIWPGQFISETVMSSAVMKARKAVGDDAHSQSVIKTLHGYGYRFVAELKFLEEPPQADVQ
jgi:DNA-binding winged helix-turn-helix (wHTH) protein